MKKTSLSWISIYLVTFLAAYLYTFNEWLFAVTKPSFLNELGFLQQFEIFLAVSALLASLCFVCLLPLVILSFVPIFKRYLDILIKLGGLLPAVIFASLILIMVDNFTYTVFKWGIVSTHGWNRGLYGLGFILLMILCYGRTLKSLVRRGRQSKIWGIRPKWLFSLLTGVMLFSIATLVFPDLPRPSPLSVTGTSDTKQHPHILLITSDGLSASHMSVYGYTRDTTPRIRQLAASALVAENAFPNSGKSSGSVISIYTGKYPAETGLLLASDVLKGDDAYEHLPGILRSQGYRTVQITAPYYLDATTLNVVEGFDEVKTSSGVAYSKYIDVISKVLPHDKALFTDEIMKRYVDRIRHILFIQQMANPYLLVTRAAEPLLDIERLEVVKHEIRTSRQPVFIHVHLMVTHGPKYKVTEQIYSAGQSSQAQALWTDDFYDDSILELDKNIGELIDYLTDLGMLDNTVVIIGSDHGQKWDPLKRLPLIFRFPYGRYAGPIQPNVQNLDIAPTILDYIGLDQPAWMRGRSLLAGELEQRLIFSMSALDAEDLMNMESSVINEENLNWYLDGLYSTNLIYCQQWFKLDVYNRSWESGFVEGSTATCRPGDEITDDQAFLWITKHLKANGMEISFLSRLSPGAD